MGWEAEEGECDEASWGKLDRATKGREGRSHSVEKRVETEPGRPEMLSGGLWAQGEGEPGIRAIRNGGRKDIKIKIEYPEQSCSELEVSAKHLTEWSLD